MSYNRILIVVQYWRDQEILRRLFDLEKLMIVTPGSSLTGYRFKAIINTVRANDMRLGSERQNYERWLREDLPLKLEPGAQIIQL